MKVGLCPKNGQTLFYNSSKRLVATMAPLILIRGITAMKIKLRTPGRFLGDECRNTGEQK